MNIDMSEVEKIIYWKNILRSMNESSQLKEDTICQEIKTSEHDIGVKNLLEAIYLEKDREKSFERFIASDEFKIHYNEILRHCGNNKQTKICEVGAGHGFLALALALSGFTNICILEPNNQWITGTGYIESRAATSHMKIWNSIDDWYSSDELYDLIISKACVHHFNNVCKIAAEIRCKIKPTGKWMMFDEFFATSSEDLYKGLAIHAHVVKHGQYEWPYSASLYVDMLEIVGYKLIEVLPNRYENNFITRNIHDRVMFTSGVTAITKILVALKLTVFAFKLEKFVDNCFGLKQKLRSFTLPQLMVFESELVKLPEVVK